MPEQSEVEKTENGIEITSTSPFLGRKKLVNRKLLSSGIKWKVIPLIKLPKGHGLQQK